jgi:hypothetical protein
MSPSSLQDITTNRLPQSWTKIPSRNQGIVVSQLIQSIETIIEVSSNAPIALGDQTALEQQPSPLAVNSLDVITQGKKHQEITRIGKYQSRWTGYFAPLREALIVCVLLFLILQTVFVFAGGNTLKNVLFKQTFAGLDQLKQAKDDIGAADLEATVNHFISAKSAFLEARESLQVINHGESVLSSSLITTSSQLLSIGENLASVGNELTEGAQLLLSTANWKLALPSLKKAANQLKLASLTIKNVDPSILPADYQEKFNQLKADLPILDQYLDLFDQISPALLEITADKGTKRYLIVLQNTTERRGTGGFMGSFIEVTFQNGKLLSVTPKDVYTVDWQQFNRKVAPEGLQPYMKGLALRDANYNPDFYQASQDINWAYGEARQGSLDGVIAIDQSIAPALLKVLGPIYLSEFDVTLTDQNYFTILQYYIETNKDDPETPKRILLAFIKETLAKVTTPENILKVAQFVPQMIAEKHVQVALFDPELETLVEKYGLDGKLLAPEPKLDYLHINSINVGGNKGDRFLSRDYQHTATINNDGTVTISVQGKWQHHWSEKEADQIRALFPQIDKLPRQLRENFWHVIGDSLTKHIVRIFVPKGSTLIENNGFNYSLKSSEENGYAVWFSEVDVPVSGATDFSFSYQLPEKLDLRTGDNYRFLLQKQAGAEQETLTHTVELGDHVKLIADYPGSTSQGSENITTKTDLNTDRYFELLVKQK